MSLLKTNEIQNYNGSSLTLTASTVSTSAQLNTGGNISVTGSLNVSDDSTTRTNLGLGTIATQDSDSITVTGGTATLGALTVSGSDSGDLVRITQTGSGNALVVEDSANPDSTPFVVDASGNVGVGKIPSYKLDVDGAMNLQSGANLQWGSADNYVAANSSLMLFGINGTEHMRIDSSGDLLFGTTDKTLYANTSGNGFSVVGSQLGVAKNDKVAYFNRMATDGTIVEFYQAGTKEGEIYVAGSLVSYLGGNLARWSQLPDSSKNETIVKGTVMTNLDAMCEWSRPDEYWTEEDEIPVDEEGNPTAAVGDLKKAAFVEDNEQLNRMVVSSVEGDPNVAGIFVSWDDDDDQFNDMIVAMTGDLVIRIAQGVTVARGDLLMSAGDGTAKPQGDDIVRSKTIAKVTSTHISHTYEDGSYLIPCVLMAC